MKIFITKFIKYKKAKEIFVLLNLSNTKKAREIVLLYCEYFGLKARIKHVDVVQETFVPRITKNHWLVYCLGPRQADKK